jgi:superfamily II DNA/RNA helicase
MTSTLSAAPDAARPATGFAELGVPPRLVEVLHRENITTPFPIQAATLPDALAGRDILGRGRTGSGKTIAFAIPTVAAIAASTRHRIPGRPRGLVLVPTRELAVQVAATIAPLAKAHSLTCATIFGGVNQNKQVAVLRTGVDIVIACPGRLEDLIEQRLCSLDRVSVSVIDEADHMSDLGFLPSVRRLLDQTPVSCQRMLFSATLDNAVQALVDRYVKDPAIHVVDPETDEAVPTMAHYVLSVATADKVAVVRDLAQGDGRRLLFTRTKHGARKLARQLNTMGVPAVELHGDLTQPARQKNLDAFAAGTSPVLVATDIAARGIHVDEVALVVHVDPPAEHKAYLHRSGRTARAGASGVVVTLMTPEQHGDVRQLTRAAKITATMTSVSPGDAVLAQLADPDAEIRIEGQLIGDTPSAPARAGGGRGDRRGDVARGAQRGAGSASGAGSGRPRRRRYQGR